MLLVFPCASEKTSNNLRSDGAIVTVYLVASQRQTESEMHRPEQTNDLAEFDAESGNTCTDAKPSLLISARTHKVSLLFPVALPYVMFNCSKLLSARPILPKRKLTAMLG